MSKHEQLVAKNTELSRLLDEQTNLALANHTNLKTQNSRLLEALKQIANFETRCSFGAQEAGMRLIARAAVGGL